MGIYFSSLSGKQVDDAIKALENMRPQIIVTNAGSNQSVTCSCSAINYTETRTTDNTGSCIFNVPEYGTFIITRTGLTPITQPLYEFKRIIISLT